MRRPPASRRRACERRRSSLLEPSALGSSGAQTLTRRLALLGELRHRDFRALVLRGFAQQRSDGFEIGVERNLDGHVRELLSAANGRIQDGIRGDLLVRDDEPVVVVDADERVRETDLLDHARETPRLDVVAEPQRLRERDQQARDEVADRSLRREADDDPDHGRGGQDPGGDRAHLRDHQQRREDADEDDQR
jgi:hypothetical protein